MTRSVISALALALTLGLLGSPAKAQSPDYSKGVVLVPASYSLQDTGGGATLYDYDLDDPAVWGFKRARIVSYATAQKPGAIVIDTKANRLYYVLGNGKAAMYRVATAKAGFEWSGTEKVTGKTTWPDWRPPAEMRKRRPELPVFMAGGPKNPLGARAIYLGGSVYRIHGTNEPSSIGKPASSGCIRMLNADVIELYTHVKIGATVTVL
jgi:lipoprotein-anchoring transpeptidase ErfK/SrfK